MKDFYYGIWDWNMIEYIIPDTFNSVVSPNKR